jgi:hypothetical protein
VVYIIYFSLFEIYFKIFLPRFFNSSIMNHVVVQIILVSVFA